MNNTLGVYIALIGSLIMSMASLTHVKATVRDVGANIALNAITLRNASATAGHRLRMLIAGLIGGVSRKRQDKLGFPLRGHELDIL